MELESSCCRCPPLKIHVAHFFSWSKVILSICWMLGFAYLYIIFRLHFFACLRQPAAVGKQGCIVHWHAPQPLLLQHGPGDRNARLVPIFSSTFSSTSQLASDS